MIVIISGRQGVGKTTLINAFLTLRPEFKLAISSTTRPKRQNEHHNEYEFLTIDEFLKKEQEDYFIEIITFNGNKYGTPKHQFKKNYIFNVTASSIENFLRCIGSQPYKTIFIDADEEIIIERLQKRGNNHKEDIKLQITGGQKEEEFKKYFQYIIKNDILKHTLDKLINIIDSEK